MKTIDIIETKGFKRELNTFSDFSTAIQMLVDDLKAGIVQAQKLAVQLALVSEEEHNCAGAGDCRVCRAIERVRRTN
jgi:hypothetical protein